MFLTDEERAHWQPAIELGASIVSGAQERGYFGPLGIDAMRYRDGDEVRLRPVMDINARWTMGRVAYEWGQRLAPSEQATWLVGQAAEEAISLKLPKLKWISTSSAEIGGIASVLIVGSIPQVDLLS